MTKIANFTCFSGALAAVCLAILPLENLFAQRRHGASTHEALRQFVRDELSYNAEGPAPNARFAYALVDLNGDNIPEAIVRVVDRQVCGSGGCNLYVLALRGSTYRIVSHTSISRPPIRVLPTRSHGWSNISVWVEGGGIFPGYEAELFFNGSTYPRNPTVHPARHLSARNRGRVVIPTSAREFPVY